MKFQEILTTDCIKVPLAATDKHGAIDELIDLLAAIGRVTMPDALKEAVWTRELTRTTGIGHGLAIPHGKCTGLSNIVIAIGRPAAPMPFQAIDSKPVRLIILLASPPDNPKHIQALAHISKLMNKEEFRERIYTALTAQDIFDLIKAQE